VRSADDAVAAPPALGASLRSKYSRPRSPTKPRRALSLSGLNGDDAIRDGISGSSQMRQKPIRERQFTACWSSDGPPGS